jgi:hypothetical protein
MNIAHDHKTCMTGHPQGRAGDAFTDYHLPIDWQDLRSRLFAACEIRTVLSPDATPLRLRLRGSFDGCAASVLTTYQDPSTRVNPNVSGYRKSDGAKISSVAGPSSTGRRG